MHDYLLFLCHMCKQKKSGQHWYISNYRCCFSLSSSERFPECVLYLSMVKSMTLRKLTGGKIVFSRWLFWLPVLDPAHPTSRACGYCRRRLFQEVVPGHKQYFARRILGLACGAENVIPSWQPNRKHVSRTASLVSAQVHVGEWKRQGTFVKMMQPHMQRQFHSIWQDIPLLPQRRDIVSCLPRIIFVGKGTSSFVFWNWGLRKPVNLNEPQFLHL